MRWIVLIIGVVFIAGCAELSSRWVEARYRISKTMKDWAKDDGAGNGYRNESDASKAHHEQTVVDTLNGWIGRNDPK